MIRLYNIINDPDIPASVSALISDITLAATKRHMIETGQLEAGEPLIMLFHGTNRESGRNITENGFSKASSDSGFEHDFSGGTYLTQHLESAEVYAGGRKRPDAGPNEPNALNGVVIPYIVRGRNLGEMIDVRTGGAHRDAWVRFVTENQGLFDQMRVDPEYLRRPETLQALIAGKPLLFGTFDAEGRGKVFNAFLESLGQPRNRPDIIFGDLGGPLTSGKQFHGGITDQAAVRSPQLIDLLNAQHGSQNASGSAENQGGTMRAIGDNDEAGNVMNSLVKATDKNTGGNIAPVKPVQTQVDRLAPHYAAALKTVLDGLPPKLRIQLERDMQRLNMIDQSQFIKMILEPDAKVRQKALFDLSAEQLGKQMESGDIDWGFISGTVRNLIVIEGVIGPNLRYMADHLATVAGPNFVLPPGVPAKFAKAVKESPFLASIAKTNPEILQDFEATFFKRDKNRVAPARDVQASLLASKGKLAKSSNDAKIKDAAQLVLDRGDKEIPKRLDYRDALEQAILVARKEVVTGPTIVAEIPVSPLPKVFDNRTPLSAATDTEPGMIIDHPVHGRGTVTAVHADHVDVVFPGVGKLPQNEQLAYADGQIFPARNVGSDKDLEVVPILDSSARQKGQAEIDQVRKDEGFGPYLKKAEAGTVCIARAGKHKSIGTNSTMSAKSATLHLDERAHLLKLMVAMGLDPHSTTKDPRFLHHAELASLINLRAQIKESGGVMPTVVEMHVDRVTCNSCLKNLSLVAAYLGIEELRVYTRGNMGNGPPLILRARR